MSRTNPFSARKHGGDDKYSWALLDNGRPIMEGMDRNEAQHRAREENRKHQIKLAEARLANQRSK